MDGLRKEKCNCLFMQKYNTCKKKISTWTSLLLESYRGGRTGTKFLRPSAE